MDITQLLKQPTATDIIKELPKLLTRKGLKDMAHQLGASLCFIERPATFISFKTVEFFGTRVLHMYRKKSGGLCGCKLELRGAGLARRPLPGVEDPWSKSVSQDVRLFDRFAQK